MSQRFDDDLNAPRAVAALFDFVRAAIASSTNPVAPAGTARALAAFERVTGVLDVVADRSSADPALARSSRSALPRGPRP